MPEIGSAHGDEMESKRERERQERIRPKGEARRVRVKHASKSTRLDVIGTLLGQVLLGT